MHLVYNHQLDVFMHRTSHNQISESLASIFIRTESIHMPNLRNQNTYFIQTNTRTFTTNYSGFILSNALSLILQQLLSSIHDSC